MDHLGRDNFREGQIKMCLGHLFSKKNKVCSGVNKHSNRSRCLAWILRNNLQGNWKKTTGTNLCELKFIPTLLKWRDPKLTNLVEEIFLGN